MSFLSKFIGRTNWEAVARAQEATNLRMQLNHAADIERRETTIKYLRKELETTRARCVAKPHCGIE